MKRRMVGHLHDYCRTRPDYRAAWEAEAAGLSVEPTPVHGPPTHGAPGQAALPPLPPGGPGKEQKAILVSLGIPHPDGCTCNHRAQQMDRWGSAGCKEHFREIVGWLREAREQYAANVDWGEAIVKAIRSGLAFRLNPFNPEPGIVKEAIRRAAAKGF